MGSHTGHGYELSQGWHFMNSYEVWYSMDPFWYWIISWSSMILFNSGTDITFHRKAISLNTDIEWNSFWLQTNILMIESIHDKKDGYLLECGISKDSPIFIILIRIDSEENWVGNVDMAFNGDTLCCT